MASVQSLRDPIQRTTGGAARGAATRRPTATAQVTVDLDALFGAAPPPLAERAARRAERAAVLPARAPAKSRSHIAIAGLLIGVAGLIALYVQLYSLNTERQGASPQPASAPPSPQAILPASAAPRSEPAAATTSETIKAPTESPVLRSLLAADRQAPRPPRATAEAIGATTAVPTAAESVRATQQGAAQTDAVAAPLVANAMPPTAASAAPVTASTPASTLVAVPVPQSPVAMADPTPPTVGPAALVPLSRPQPAFPQQALRDRVAGRVVARVTVGTDGAVTDVQIESSTPPRVFDRAAVAALRQWRYAPIGQPQQTTIELDFKLE